MRKPSMTKAKETKPEIDPAELTAAEFARFKNTALKFWMFCGRPRCQRGKSCLGPDALKCFDQCWARVPEPQKFWIREAIKARAAGLSLEDTMKKADAAEACCIEEMKSRAAEAAALTASPVAPEQPVPQTPMPRLRVL
jgi:hypothetical protein